MSLLEELETGIAELDGGNRFLILNAAAEQGLAAGRERLAGVALQDCEGIPPELVQAVAATRADHRARRLHECRLQGGLYDCNLQLLDNGHLLLELFSLEWEQQRLQLQQREVQTGLLDLLRRNLGHEIRNPLGGIRGAAQMMAAELGEHELATLARLIMREVDRIDELIARFWQPQAENEAVDLHHVIEETVELISAQSAGATRVARDYDPSIPEVRGDSAALRRLILNLARNAWQAGAGEVRFRTRIEHGSALLEAAQGTAVRLDVEDDGDGVPEKLRPLLFMPMVTGRREGTGLGLALAQQIAGAHGGLVSYEPLERGSRFSLRLPVGEARADG